MSTGNTLNFHCPVSQGVFALWESPLSDIHSTVHQHLAQCFRPQLSFCRLLSAVDRRAGRHCMCATSFASISLLFRGGRKDGGDLQVMGKGVSVRGGTRLSSCVEFAWDLQSPITRLAWMLCDVTLAPELCELVLHKDGEGGHETAGGTMMAVAGQTRPRMTTIRPAIMTFQIVP